MIPFFPCFGGCSCCMKIWLIWMKWWRIRDRDTMLMIWNLRRWRGDYFAFNWGWDWFRWQYLDRGLDWQLTWLLVCYVGLGPSTLETRGSIWFFIIVFWFRLWDLICSRKWSCCWLWIGWFRLDESLLFI